MPDVFGRVMAEKVEELFGGVDVLRRLKREVGLWLEVGLRRDQWVRDHVEVARKELGIAVKMMEEEDDESATS